MLVGTKDAVQKGYQEHEAQILNTTECNNDCYTAPNNHPLLSLAVDCTCELIAAQCCAPMSFAELCYVV